MPNQPDHHRENCGKAAILIVEDEAVIALGMQADLEKQGYRVVGTACRGTEALEMVRLLQPDLILMDVMLRGDMDGVEAATIIRQRFDLPVIFLTALSDEQTIQRAKQSNPFGYILKPTQAEELAAAIEFGLYKYQLEQQVRRSEEMAHRRAAELESLYQLSSKLRQAQTQKEMLPILLDQAIRISQAAQGAIYLLESGGRPGCCFQLPAANDSIPDWFRPGEPLWQNVLSDKCQPICIEVAQQSISSEPGSSPPASFGGITKIAFALRSTHSIAGILALGFPTSCLLGEESKQALLALAEIAGNALQRSGTMEMLEQRVADRTRELSALYDLALIMSTPHDLEQILHDSLNRALSPVGAQAAALFLYDAKENVLNLALQIALPQEILAEAYHLTVSEPLKTWLETSDSPMLSFKGQGGMPYRFSVSASFGSVANIPVRFEGQTLALLTILWSEIEDIAAEDIALLSTVAVRLGGAIQKDAYRKQAEQAVVLEERNRLARQLHDSVTQSLYSLALLAEAGRDLAAKGDTARLDRCLHGLEQSSLQALREMRLLLFELRLPDMKDKNLIQALEKRLAAVERRAGIEVQFSVDGSVDLSTEYQEELYQIAGEALNNIIKHAQASRVWLEIQSSPEAFRMKIEDDGCGFDPQAVPKGGMGLENMQERTRQLGGEYCLASQPGKGTCISVTFG